MAKIFYESDCQENIIVSYENKGKFGKHNVYNLERIVKSDNSIAMIDIYENNRKKYIILSSLNRDDFDSINIMNKSTNKILEEIDLKNIWTILGEIIGETYTDELLDNLFRDFCVGK